MTRRETPNDIRSQKLQRRKNKLVVSRRNFTRFGTYQNEPSCLYTYQFVNWSNFVFVSESEQLFIFIFFQPYVHRFRRRTLLITFVLNNLFSKFMGTLTHFIPLTLRSTFKFLYFLRTTFIQCFTFTTKSY